MVSSFFAALALTVTAPFITGLEPGADAPVAVPPTPSTDTSTPTPAPAPTPAPVAAPVPALSPVKLDPRVAGAALKQPAGTAPTNGAMSNLVAEAIKRKLDRVAAGKTSGGVEVPTSPSASPPAITTPSLDAPIGMPFGPGDSPQASMMSTGARVMMGSPTDGSPSYIRTVTPTATPNAAEQPAQAPSTNTKAGDSNPLARSADPMESGTDSAAAASQPGANHNLLDIFVGTWDVSANFDTGPGQPPETANGQMVNTWQLEGRWLKQEYTGQMASLGAFRGLGFLGYDNLQKTFVGTWMDTLSTSCLMSKGGFDEAHSTFTLSGDFTVTGGDKYKQKQVMTILGPDRYVVSMYLTGPDGVEFKTGNLEYTRSIKKVSVAPAK